MTDKTMVILVLAALALAAVCAALLIAVLVKLSRCTDSAALAMAVKEKIAGELSATRQEIVAGSQQSFTTLSAVLAQSQKQSFERQDVRLSELTASITGKQEVLQKSVTDSLRTVDERFRGFSALSEQKLDNMRTTMENRLAAIQEDNGKKLEKMRETVDEKLQKTLEEKLGQSFSVVSERLEQVYKGLGEMQNLAAGVGDLKKVLSNVKTRGVLGEIQLGAILEEILSTEQYEKNVETRPHSGCRVEFAVKMPADEGRFIYLPIDAKFPIDAYSNLMDAYDAAEPARIETAATELCNRIKRFAKDISEKYVEPPYTTEFGVMFLPTEGLYAEVVRRGLVETLQRDYRVTVAGPTTMAALLNSLQMGFRTLAIQQRSSEVWNVLGAVKTEFDRFGAVLETTQNRITQANEELDKLVGVRTRKIRSKLRDVTVLPGIDSDRLLGMGDDEADGE